MSFFPGFFSRLALFEITFTNSRGGLLFKMNPANIEIDDYKTICTTTTQIFKQRNMLKIIIIIIVSASVEQHAWRTNPHG